jgi:hypothetical protein
MLGAVASGSLVALSGNDIKEQHMDAVRSGVRLITQAALVTTTVTERVTVALLRCAVERAHRMPQPRGNGPSAHDGVSPAAGAATLSAKAGR